ncbi:DHA2 family multidrug resistance protein-like MFS transporter [Pseudomonas fluvialis]|uniref:DHA2 family multidrug resistance protein-like MFS transporter n=1 Tax=Pseudomonas fluvialis TaxID=1793966 RepID=A0A7X0BUD2_9PSED|nr:MFS transporter [Pseudomonas fluvialis]MBB6342847.1 DHA2 family multidrug resistance protein-like MFS transporter [Pseudomonas fluvialis]
MNHPAPETGFQSAQTEHAGVAENALDASLQPSTRRLAAIASVLAALALVVLNTSITNTALPTIAQSLEVTPALSIWVLTANQAALLIALLPCAALGESFGFRKVFRWGVGAFLAGTLMCVLAPTLNWLIAARLLQGLGGAVVMALAVALLRQVVPSHQLGAAIGWNALVVALASAAGPALGAAILAVAEWPWLFSVLLPFGLLVILASGAIPVVEGTNRKADLLSMALNAGVLGSLVIAAGVITDRPALTAALLTISAIQLVLLVKRERQKEAPLIPLDLLRSNSFRISVIASVLSFTGQTAGLVALPFYLHHNLGQGILETGLLMLPWPLTVALFARVMGHLSGRCSTALLCCVGGVCLATGLTGAALWPLQANLLMLVPLTMLCGLGFSLFNVANNRNMFLAAPISRSGAAGGMQGTARLLGQTAGAVIMTLLFKVLPAGSAPQFALCVGASLNLFAALVSAQQPMTKAIS